jgi:hypothetical protein
VLDDEAFSAGCFRRFHCRSPADWRANRAGCSMQQRAPVRHARALVVVATYRWPKVLVRRQIDDFENIVALVA